MHNQYSPEIDASIECVWPAGALLGESPLWDDTRRRLFWLDIQGKKLFAFTPQTGERQIWTLPLRVGSIGQPQSGWPVPEFGAALSFLAGTEKGFAWLIADDTTVDILPIVNPESHLPGNRFNDGKFGPDGRYYAGTMDDAEQQATGALYALDKNGEVTKLDDGYVVTNGPAFAPDRRTVYHTDSARQTIFKMVLGGDGRLSRREVFCRFTQDEGYPDGMTTDCTGDLWVAFWDGGRIERISPDGRRLGQISMPTQRITSCAFAGADDSTLFATSAAIGIRSSDKLAGGLLRITLLSKDRQH